MSNYAENIKKIRLRKKYTQSELAEGIASQGMISKIEKKQLSPDIDLLEAIAEKLNCSIMDLLTDNNDNELKQAYSYMNDLVKRREYNLLGHFFKNESMIETIKTENEGYYRWIKGILLSQNEDNFEEGIKELTLALEKTSENSLKIRILTGLSNLYSEMNQFEESLQYLLDASTLSEKVKVDIELKQRINYQLARVYSVMEQFGHSIFHNRLAIQFAINHESLYLLDDLYLLLGDSYLRLNQLDKANINVALANTIAELKSNTQLIPYIERTQLQISENSKKQKKNN